MRLFFTVQKFIKCQLEVFARIFLVLFLMILSACTHDPTKVYQTLPVQTTGSSANRTDDSAAAVKSSVVHSIVPILISEKTVILDARPAFDFTVSHINGALPVRPEDFTQREKSFLGLLEKDLFFHTRRLARMGITPESSVVVVGRGTQGQGEEGRVAWTLKYLGVRDVRFASMSYFHRPLSSLEAPPPKSLPIWKPVTDKSLLIEKKDLSNLITLKKKQNETVVFLDVREKPADFQFENIKNNSKLLRECKDQISNMKLINISWKKFFDERGLSLMPTELLSLIPAASRANTKVILISNQGVESGAVTMALRELGMQSAANYSGGFLELGAL